jgi:hypothetical protein
MIPTTVSMTGVGGLLIVSNQSMISGVVSIVVARLPFSIFDH